MPAETTAGPQAAPLRIAIGALAVLAIPAIAVAIIALQKSSQNLTRIHSLEHQVHVLAAASGGATKSVGSRVQALEGSVSTIEEQAKAAAAKQSKTDASMHQLLTCVPELQSQIGSLELSRAGETYFVRSTSNVSKDCTNLLYGTG